MLFRSKIIDKSNCGRIAGFSWSPDGNWLAYSIPVTHQLWIIKLYNLKTGKTFPVTEQCLKDVAPSFDPDGKYLYFISYRVFDPVYDNMNFDLGFPRGGRPFLVTLRKDILSPFQNPHKKSESFHPEKPKAKGKDKPKDFWRLHTAK